MLREKGRVRTQDLGYQAECYDHYATRPIEKNYKKIEHPCSLMWTQPETQEMYWTAGTAPSNSARQVGLLGLGYDG
jgi:hypothetical protein